MEMSFTKDPVIPPQGYDYCLRCWRWVKIEEIRADDEDARPPPCESDVIIDGRNARRYQPAHRTAARLREHAGKHSA